MKLRSILQLLFALGAVLTSFTVAAAASGPNVVLILADDLGYGDLGCYGQRRIQTPHIDRLATEGMRFNQFYAGSTVCAPSRCVLMTGKHTGHATVRGNARPNMPLRATDLTIAAVLQKAGYATACIGKWGLGDPDTTGGPRKQGFDYFYGYLNHSHAHNYYPSYLWRNEEKVPLRNTVPNETAVGTGVSDNKIDYSADLIADEALAFIRRTKDKPFFLYFAPTQPHANNEAKTKGMEVPDLGEYAKLDWAEPQKAHAAMITRLDRDVGRVMTLLKELRLDRNTLVMFTSDNGPHKEGGADPTFNDSNGVLRGIKRDLYDGGIRVPFIAYWPGRIRLRSVSEHVGYFGDVFATICEITRQPTPAELDSVTFAPTLLGKLRSQKRHDHLYWEFYEQGSAQAVRFGNWKAIRKPIFTGKIELFDLAQDIGEMNNLAGARADLVAKATKLIDSAHVRDPAWRVGGVN